MGVTLRTGWRVLSGASPYTVLATDNEFMVAMSEESAPNVRWLIPVPRALLSTTARTIAINSDNTTDLMDAVGITFTLNAAGTSLTTVYWQESGGSGTWTIHEVLAR